MADMTIKKYDGTTDIVWTNAGPGGGDGNPAFWRPASVGTSVAKRPVARFWTQSSNTARQVCRFTVSYPLVDAVSGAILDYITESSEMKIPVVALDTDVQEAVAQFGNLRDHALIIASLIARSAPR